MISMANVSDSNVSGVRSTGLPCGVDLERTYPIIRMRDIPNIEWDSEIITVSVN